MLELLYTQPAVLVSRISQLYSTVNFHSPPLDMGEVIKGPFGLHRVVLPLIIIIIIIIYFLLGAN